jgi:septal ring factor EnvC (AmiA/AmiB activator)
MEWIIGALFGFGGFIASQLFQRYVQRVREQEREKYKEQLKKFKKIETKKRKKIIDKLKEKLKIEKQKRREIKKELVKERIERRKLEEKIKELEKRIEELEEELRKRKKKDFFKAFAKMLDELIKTEDIMKFRMQFDFSLVVREFEIFMKAKKIKVKNYKKYLSILSSAYTNVKNEFRKRNKVIDSTTDYDLYSFLLDIYTKNIKDYYNALNAEQIKVIEKIIKYINTDFFRE